MSCPHSHLCSAKSADTIPADTVPCGLHPLQVSICRSLTFLVIFGQWHFELKDKDSGSDSTEAASAARIRSAQVQVALSIWTFQIPRMRNPGRQDADRSMAQQGHQRHRGFPSSGTAILSVGTGPLLFALGPIPCSACVQGATVF